MEFAVNYSPTLAELVKSGQVQLERFKCPAWPDLLKEAVQTRPVYIHFPLAVGRGEGYPMDEETKSPADLERIADLLEMTGTPYVNTHFIAPGKHYPGIPVNSRDPRHIDQVVSNTLRDLEPLIRRFGAERVLVENIINEYGWLDICALPEVLTRVIREAGCGFLFDLSHARLAACNLGVDPRAYSSAMPVGSIREIHITGLQLLEGELLEMMRRIGDPYGMAEYMAGNFIDHLPMREEDWTELEWLVGKLRSGEFATPWVMSYEYGGVGRFWEEVTKTEVYLSQIPRMAVLAQRAVALDGPGATLTEQPNPRTADLDQLSTLEMLRRINAEDQLVPRAVAWALPQVAEAVDRAAENMQRGGRLIYVGAGTSGRLGVLDASEIPPTYGMEADRVVALIAGGEKAIRSAAEGAEDDPQAGARALADLGVGENDSVVGIAASGRTPYVLGALKEAKRRGALTISMACNSPALVEVDADIRIALLTGPEAITGSTRMKAGTAQKLALNLLSTGLMVRLGKTYGNWMVDLRATNQKLRTRACRIVGQVCGLDENAAAAALEAADGEVKTAIVAGLAGVTPQQARQRLACASGVVRKALLDQSE